jgi:hypothetical protein
VVAIIVLVDSSHEDQKSKYPETLKRMERKAMLLLQLGRLLSPFGIVPLLFIKPNPKYPGNLQPVGVALNSRTIFLTTVCREMLCLDESTAQMRAAARLMLSQQSQHFQPASRCKASINCRATPG